MKSTQSQDRLSLGARIGRLMHEKRKAEGLSLHQAAAEVGLSRTFLSRLERGEYADFKATALARISCRFSVSMDELNIATGCHLTGDLIGLEQYLQARFPEWPEHTVRAAASYCRTLDEKFSEREDGTA